VNTVLPYECIGCARRFTCLEQLTRHLCKTWECPGCNWQYESFSRVRAISCPGCGTRMHEIREVPETRLKIVLWRPA